MLCCAAKVVDKVASPLCRMINEEMPHITRHFFAFWPE